MSGRSASWGGPTPVAVVMGTGFGIDVHAGPNFACVHMCVCECLCGALSVRVRACACARLLKACAYFVPCLASAGQSSRALHVCQAGRDGDQKQLQARDQGLVKHNRQHGSAGSRQAHGRQQQPKAFVGQGGK
eukprot:scaffold1403_cov22-Tisochrysis_lutea.AAC.1